MTTPPLPLQIASLTHPGMVRSHNEDNHAVDQAAGFVILADGMGGYNAGEVASEMAVAKLTAALAQGVAAGAAPDELLRREVGQINADIFHAAQAQPHCAGMGTTLVAVLFQPTSLTVAHVGDSRLYRLRGERLEVVTRDHSLLQEQIDNGLLTREEARVSHNKNLVTRALGVEATVEVEVASHDTAPGDLYLLCSDGLNDMVADEEIERILQGADELGDAARQLVQSANDNGGRDNVTVILARVLAAPVERGVMARLAGWMKQSA